MATRRSIQVAALRLAVERGMEHVTVQAISDAADIAPSTFFTYFASKDDALVIDIPWNEARVSQAVQARPAGEPVLASMRAVAKEIGGDLVCSIEEMHVLKEALLRFPGLAHRGSDQLEMFRRGIARGLAERRAAGGEAGGGDSDVAIALLAAVTVATGELAVERWSADQVEGGGAASLPFDPYVDELFDVLEAGFR
jgi:AcrR family transcriptional regulator